MISASDELALAKELLRSGMAVLISESLVPKSSDGTLLRGGLFAVKHTKGRQRLIFDRRLLNAGEAQLPWVSLPHGTQYCFCMLESHETIRGSGDDIETYYYHLRHQDNFVHRNAVGRRFTGKRARELGADGKHHWRLAFRVVAMGDVNGVSIAQAVHEDLLKGTGGLHPGQHLVFSRAVPNSPTWEGIYIDDHLVSQVLDKTSLSCRPEKLCESCKKAGGCLHDDCRLIASSESAYAACGLPLGASKRFRYQQKFLAWGTEVDGHSGVVSAPLAKRSLLSILGLQLCASFKVNKKLMQAFGGCCIHPFMHCRPLMCLLGEFFSFTSNLNDSVSCKMPPRVLDEVLGCSLLMNMAFTNVRYPCSEKVHATDSTPSAGGSCTARVPQAISRQLLRSCEVRGEDSRLDWSPMESELWPGEMIKVSSDTAELIESLPWTEARAFKHTRLRHINLQEGLAVVRQLRSLASGGIRNVRIPFLNDSRVCVGAFSKGRSSSRAMNRILRECLPFRIMFGLCSVFLWVSTKLNPADEPSRGKPLRARKRMSPEMQRLYLENRCGKSKLWTPRRGKMFLECYAGAGGLSQAMRANGFSATSVEAFPNGVFCPEYDLDKEELVAGIEQDILNGFTYYLHLGLPCASWCIISTINHGTRRKTSPLGGAQGMEPLPRETRGNKQLKNAIRLIRACGVSGCFWSLENPESSFVWQVPELTAVADEQKVYKITFDQCMYHLRPPDSELPENKHRDLRTRKRTTILSNCHSLTSLESRCDKQHEHVEALGSCSISGRAVRRSAAAGVYPKALCRRWASLMVQCCDGCVKP